MIEDTKKQLNKLVEINSILANDLDESHHIISELCRERDILKKKVERLEEEVPRQYYADLESETVRATEQFRRQMAQEQKKAEELRYERDRALHRSNEDKERADLAEQRLHLLAMKLREVVQERNEIMAQLDESRSAMDEIRYHLAASVRTPDFFREGETEC